MNISGKVKLINETKEYGSNGFKKTYSLTLYL